MTPTGKRENARSVGKKRSASPLRYAVLLLFALAGLTTAYFSAVNAVVGITRFKNPHLTLRFSPNDPMGLIGLAGSALTSGDATRDTARSRDLILGSLRGQALNPRALLLLGIMKDVEGDRADAVRLARLSNQLTRRDLTAQIWLIEYSIFKNDIPQALIHYDVALRTSPSSPELLFPILTSALREPEIRKAFGPYIKNQPSWMTPFLHYALDNDDAQYLAMAVVQAGGIDRSDEYRDVQTRLLQKLAEAHHFQLLEHVFRTQRTVSAEMLGSAELSRGSTNARLLPVSWSFNQSPLAGSSLEPADKAPFQHVRIFSGPGEQGVMARKMLRLAPGSYDIASSQEVVRQGQKADAHWEVNCIAKPRAIFIWRGDNLMPAAAKSFGGRFNVPPACEVVFLEFVVAGGEAQDGIELVVKSVRVAPSAPSN